MTNSKVFRVSITQNQHILAGGSERLLFEYHKLPRDTKLGKIVLLLFKRHLKSHSKLI